MTRLQKVFCVLLSMLFWVIFSCETNDFFSVTNVFRQLPLYCFLEEQITRSSLKEDPETSALIVSSNAAYLAQQIEEENMRERQTETLIMGPEKEQADNPEKRKPEFVPLEKSETARTVPAASLQAKPVIDLSPERLSDFSYLLNQFFIVDAETSVTAQTLNAKEFLEKDLRMRQDCSKPQILIYHSHAQEAFADSREGKTEDTIVGVGAYLAKILEEDYGYQVIHITEIFDVRNGIEDRSKAYDYARVYLESYLEENPSVEVVIDLHRDGVAEGRRLVTTINGKKTAQIMFFNGLSYTKSNGSVSYLPNPYIQDNLAFSFQLEYQAAQYYPDFYRGIYLAGLRYNLHLRPKALLLEAGAQTNTVQEVKNAMEPFADILHRVLSGK